MRIGQEGDTRKYRRLRKSDYYEAKAAADAEVHKWVYCRICGRRLGAERRNWNGLCIDCHNEDL